MNFRDSEFRNRTLLAVSSAALMGAFLYGLIFPGLWSSAWGGYAEWTLWFLGFGAEGHLLLAKARLAM